MRGTNTQGTVPRVPTPSTELNKLETITQFLPHRARSSALRLTSEVTSHIDTTRTGKFVLLKRINHHPDFLLRRSLYCGLVFCCFGPQMRGERNVVVF
jgi:hypothetical protein